MNFHEQLQVATGLDPTLIGVALFLAMVFVLWALTHLIERPEQIREPDDRPPDSSDLEVA